MSTWGRAAKKSPVPTDLHLVTREHDRRGAVDPADDWEDAAAAFELPPAWDDDAAARWRFLTGVAKRRADTVEDALLEGGGDGSWV
jgi:hypothetical protein